MLPRFFTKILPHIRQLLRQFFKLVSSRTVDVLLRGVHSFAQEVGNQQRGICP